MGKARSLRPSCAAVLLGLCAVSVGVPCRAEMPPIGYVGEVPRPPALPALPMPLGYVGEVPRQTPLAPVAPPPQKQALAVQQPLSHTGETLIRAQILKTDSATGILTATGKVEIIRNDHALHADQVTYNQKTGVMVADGHVVLRAASGEVTFADHQEITGDLKEGVAEKMAILFQDNSRMAAARATRYEGRYTVADHALYSPCNVCRENPDQPPLWQLKADTVTHDNEAHEIYYHDVTVEMGDVPILYSPYLSMADPSVQRQQGFLSPLPGLSPSLGASVKIPYYIDIAPEQDLTVSPTFSTVDTAQIAADYRRRFAQGQLSLQGSVTRADLINENGVDQGQQWRGHLFGAFLYDIDATWRAGSDFQYVSDKSYLHRYGYSSLDQTISRAYVEGFSERNYLGLNSYAFQDLRPNSLAAEPFVLPSMTLSALGAPADTFGGRWSFDANTLITTRNNSGAPLAQQGPDTRRLSTNVGWERQLISDTGLVTTVSGLARTDSYWATHISALNGSGTNYDQALFTRPFTQANVLMRYPMGRSGDGYQQIVEPIVSFTAAPDVRSIAKQPIEDSLDVEFDETNLFSPNRFTGSDLIEGGSRATYGIRQMLTTTSGAHIDIFGGESYDFTRNNLFPSQSGLNGHASDYVGRMDFMPANWFDANYGFRLSQANLSPQQQDAQVSFGAPILRPSIRYIEAYETDTATNLVDLVRQATLGFTSKFATYWILKGEHTQAFDPQPGPRNSSLSLNYVDECFAAGVTVGRENTTRVDMNSGTSVGFHLYLRNLGGFHTDSGAAPGVTNQGMSSGFPSSVPAEFRPIEP